MVGGAFDSMYMGVGAYGDYFFSVKDLYKHPP